MRRFLVTAALAAMGAAVLAGTAGAAPAAKKPAPKVWDVPVRHLTGGARGDVGYQVFYTEQAWKLAVKQHPWSGAQPAGLPAVDWKKDMVLTATDGTRPTAGYGLAITGVQRVGADIVVRVRETRPAAGAILAQVITHPSDAVAVRRMEGPVQFVITKDAPPPPGLPNPPPAATDEPETPPDVDTLAKSVFTLRETGGIAGLDSVTVIHLYGRPLQPGEAPSDARSMKDVEVAGPVLRGLEQTVRTSGFLGLRDRYAPAQTHPDQMTRVITVRMPGVTKSVSVDDGAPDVPAAFGAVWTALDNAIPRQE